MNCGLQRSLLKLNRVLSKEEDIMKHFFLRSKSTSKKHNILLAISFSLFFLLLSVTLSNIALAQDKYPNKPITYVVGYPPGGASEVSSRAITTAASKFLPQPIILVTKPGGSSTIALTWLKNEKPDGYSIGLLPTGPVVQQFLRKLQYDTNKDFTPIMQFARFQEGLVVRSDSPWKTLGELVEYARANPEKIRYSTSGPGSPTHMVMEQLGTMAKVKFKHIPFEGTTPSIAAVLGGHVEACADNTFWKPHVLSGRLRLLGAFGETRIPFAPDVPTLKESGYDAYHASMVGIIGPKGMPLNVVDTLHTAFKKALEDQDFLKVMDQMDMVVVYRNPKEMAAAMVEFNEKVGTMVTRLGLHYKE
jgi:tripartite-type tricarboxylate transporter receptor subunit TctC